MGQELKRIQQRSKKVVTVRQVLPERSSVLMVSQTKRYVTYAMTTERGQTRFYRLDTITGKKRQIVASPSLLRRMIRAKRNPQFCVLKVDDTVYDIVIGPSGII